MIACQPAPQYRASASCSPRITEHEPRNTPLSPLESALTDKHRVLPCFLRNGRSASPLESPLTSSRFVTPLESALAKKPGGGGNYVTSLPAIFQVGPFGVRRLAAAFPPATTRPFSMGTIKVPHSLGWVSRGHHPGGDGPRALATTAQPCDPRSLPIYTENLSRGAARHSPLLIHQPLWPACMLLHLMKI